MFTNKTQKLKLAMVVLAPLGLFACSDDSPKGDTATSGFSVEEQKLTQDTPFAYVQRSVESQAEASIQNYKTAVASLNKAPLDLSTPYDFNPGAKLFVRSSLDVNALDQDILSEYFGSDEYDVKDVNVSADGKRLIFAAHGPMADARNNTWNIFEYTFEHRLLRRVIEEDSIANAGEDTNPTFALDGSIIFSSDRSAGNPNSPKVNIVEEGSDCIKVGPSEKPSLLHSMTSLGENILQLTYGANHDTKPTTMRDGRISFVRWSRSYDLVPQCAGADRQKADLSNAQLDDIFNKSYPDGLDLPEEWSTEDICAFTQDTELGPVISSNHYTLLRITQDGAELEQLYETVSVSASDEEFLTLNELVQGENGQLMALLKHEYNPYGGGNLLQLEAPGTATSSQVFQNFSPSSLTSGLVDLYPNQLSENGWYSALWPYRDGSSRLLISWSQCSTIENGVNSFCTAGDDEGVADSRYGIWMYDPASNSRLPIVRAKPDVVYTDLAMAQAHTGAYLPFAAYNPDYVDNMDESRIICNDPGIDPDEPEEPVEEPPTVVVTPEDPAEDPETPVVVVTPEDPAEDPETPVVVVTPEDPAEEPETPVVVVTPEDPAEEPETPVVVVTPEDPAEEPETPVVVVTPEDPAEEPETPVVVVTPEDPAEEPETPVVVETPEDPAEEPETPVVVTPEDPAEEPETPVVVETPEDPAEEPETPVVVETPEDPVDEPVDMTPVEPVEDPTDPETPVVVDTPEDPVEDPVDMTPADPVDDPVEDPVDMTPADPVDDPVEDPVDMTPADPVDDPVEDPVDMTPADPVEDPSDPETPVEPEDPETPVDPEEPVEPENTAPIADAGEDQSLYMTNSVELSGLGSFDPDGDELTYSWSLVEMSNGTSAGLSDTEVATPTLEFEGYGSFTLELIVSDGELSSEPDYVIITSNNSAPFADAGDNVEIELGELVSLDGSGSLDPDGDDITYDWMIVERPDDSVVTLSDAGTSMPSFTPDVSGTYVAQLIVSDGLDDSEPDTVSILVSVPPAVCDTSRITRRSMPFTMRDFTSAHPDFEGAIGVDYGIVKQDLGDDGKPVYAHGRRGTRTTNGPKAFNQWYNTVDGVNLEIPMNFELSRIEGTNYWEYVNGDFFPLDGMGFGNTPNWHHNYHFTLETHLEFHYEGGEVFTFRGDDDLFLFINGKLAIDIGGVHAVLERTVDLDEIADYLGIEPGNTYSFDLFFAERHTTESNFMFQTNINLECISDDDYTTPGDVESFKVTGGGSMGAGAGNFGFNVNDDKVHLLYIHRDENGDEMLQVKINAQHVAMASTPDAKGIEFTAGCTVTNLANYGGDRTQNTCAVKAVDDAEGDIFELEIIDGPHTGIKSDGLVIDGGNIVKHY